MNFAGRNALITGAANGIGLGLCRSLARRGVNIVLADIERDTLASAERDIAGFGVKTKAVALDVSDSAAMEQALADIEATFGRIHFLCNNAGVSAGAKPIWEIGSAEWDWMLGVNLHGVINGVRACLPRMLNHGEGGYVINTASIGGLQVNPDLRNGSYATTKYAIVALSEALAIDLKGTSVGVSVLCPGLVTTTLHASAQRRPDRFGGASDHANRGTDPILNALALTPDVVGERAMHAVERSEFFIFTHEEPRAWIEARHQRLLDGFDRLAAYNAQDI